MSDNNTVSDNNIYLPAFGRLNLLIAGMGLIASLLLHRFFYDVDRQWFTEHRIAPGTGIILMGVGIMANRDMLRRRVESHDPRVETALDALAVLAAFTSFALGVLGADLVREWNPKK